MPAIDDVDLADLVDETVAEIRRARLDHLVVFFRGQGHPGRRSVGRLRSARA
jgi:alpha-ketoglutarate-dependent taurine dioxygenase